MPGARAPLRQQRHSLVRHIPNCLLGPLPLRDSAQRVEIVVGAGVRVLHRDVRPELHVGAQRLPERRVAGKLSSVGGGQVQRDEPLSLLLGDLQTAVHLDQVRETTHRAGELVRPAERLTVEGGQLVDVLGPAGSEQRLEERVGEHAGVEGVDESAQPRLAAGVLVQALHQMLLQLSPGAMNHERTPRVHHSRYARSNSGWDRVTTAGCARLGGWTWTSDRSLRSSRRPTRSFGRAAQQLHLSQQALSKRIARLEASVGTLFVRQPGGVLLTARGVRFLPAARELLVVAEAAAAAARAPIPAPLQVDVWGHLHPPFALVESFATGRPDLVVQMGMRRSLPLALTALQRREIDAAFGNVAGLSRPLPPGLSSELVTTTPLMALLNSNHPLAARSHLSADDLREHGLWWPTEPGSPELDRFATDYARTLGVPLSTGGRNLGLNALLEAVRTDPGLITIISEDWPLAPGLGLRRVPLRPALHYPWYLVWPTRAAHPAVAALRAHAHAHGRLPPITTEPRLPTGGTSSPADLRSPSPPS